MSDGSKLLAVKKALAAMLLLAACSSGASPSPQPLQRVERSLPAPVEETAAAAAGGKLYVMGGFNAAGVSLNTVYVFDGSRWASGPRLPLPLDHSSAATLVDRVYVAGGHSNGGDSARLFRLDATRWTELASMHFARGGHARPDRGERQALRDRRQHRPRQRRGA
jgi:hypothetical protein